MKIDLKAIAKKDKKRALHLKRKMRIRKVISGTAEHPRLSVFKSSKHIYIQAIDDVVSRTIISAGTLEKAITERVKGLKKVEAAKVVGEALGERLKSANIASAVFDRNGFRYTGRIAAVADGIRSTGLVI